MLLESSYPRLAFLHLMAISSNGVPFWEQFEVAIHSKEHLTDAEKLEYLKESLSEGPTRHVVEGLTQTAGTYSEAISYLQK